MTYGLNMVSTRLIKSVQVMTVMGKLLGLAAIITGGIVHMANGEWQYSGGIRATSTGVNYHKTIATIVLELEHVRIRNLTDYSLFRQCW